jgi:hypothetical protein
MAYILALLDIKYKGINNWRGSLNIRTNIVELYKRKFNSALKRA